MAPPTDHRGTRPNKLGPPLPGTARDSALRGNLAHAAAVSRARVEIERAVRKLPAGNAMTEIARRLAAQRGFGRARATLSRVWTPCLFGLTECRDISKINRPPRCALHSNEVVPRCDRDGVIAKRDQQRPLE
jgi:hypothetical protein